MQADGNGRRTGKDKFLQCSARLISSACARRCMRVRDPARYEARGAGSGAES